MGRFSRADLIVYAVGVCALILGLAGMANDRISYKSVKINGLTKNYRCKYYCGWEKIRIKGNTICGQNIPEDDRKYSKLSSNINGDKLESAGQTWLALGIIGFFVLALAAIGPFMKDKLRPYVVQGALIIGGVIWLFACILWSSDKYACEGKKGPYRKFDPSNSWYLVLMGGILSIVAGLLPFLFIGLRQQGYTKL